MKSFPFLLAGALLMLTTSCERILVGEETANTPVNNFEKLWSDFDTHYGLFEVKNIDWDSMYQVYSPQVSDNMTDEAFYDLVVSMLTPLNDKHITLYPAACPSLPRWSVDLNSEGAFVLDNYDFEVIEENYLQTYHELSYSLGYGTLSADIGYIRIREFPGAIKDIEKQMDQILNELESTKGIVLDMRENGGGFDPTAQYIAGRFSGNRQHYMTVKKRNGPARTDFTDPVEWYVEPTGDFRYTKPIVLLTSRATISAGETFCLAMRELDNVTHLGETTAGAFSDAIAKELHNGWLFTLSVGDYRASDGKSYEGIGLEPDVAVMNLKADVLAGKDEALEKAMEQLGR